ncbi:hypothetical protein [uncultured Acetobacteroides sp.]|uniref:PulJ/GspJ family protein n=1 Tax=uncultured Acetobacteroides sp. TaxID=1760811 RepID=UPI0029F45850|nr:hypothetical protein [uncultured Acetobacteroides sp.]
MSRSQLKAFTIPELLVAMLVSAIVLIAVLYGFQLVGGLLVSTQKRSLATTNAVVLYAALGNDFARADSIVQRGDTLLICSDSLRVRYYLDSARLIRQQPPRLDTLSSATILRNVGHHPLMEQYVTSVSLSVSINGRPSTFTFEKQYDPSALFEAHSSTIEKKWELKYRK